MNKLISYKIQILTNQRIVFHVEYQWFEDCNSKVYKVLGVSWMMSMKCQDAETVLIWMNEVVKYQKNINVMISKWVLINKIG